ncbi:hypothetical protein PC119_g22830 [Phytophthora cactorum]|nr:hypothetical protein PC119_g22830 [Phytophthora cactorum]
MAESKRDLAITRVLDAHKIETQSRFHTEMQQAATLLDSTRQLALSTLVRNHGFSLVQLVELARGQTPEDRRPNKALCPRRYEVLLQGYRHERLLRSIAAEGISTRWLHPDPLPDEPPANHQFAKRHLGAVVSSICMGQDAGQYLILDDEIVFAWHGVQFSPFGAVTEKDVDPSVEIRLIHDLSYPKGKSTNDASDSSCFPSVDYISVSMIARRIDECAARHPGVRVCIMKGDVKDMSAPFGWSGSPPYYAAFGKLFPDFSVVRAQALSAAAQNADTEPFFPYEWVDDHVLVEADTPGHLDAAPTALRLAMLAILGPRAINEKNFSTWSTRIEVLRLEFDTELQTVSMPASKIDKSLQRVRRLAERRDVSCNDLECLLGSLHHVCICLRSARRFFQRLHQACKRAPRRGSTPATASLRLDLAYIGACTAFNNLCQYISWTRVRY